jgi:hypothetical protein
MRLIGTVWLGWSLAAQIVFQPTLSAPPVVGGRLAGAVLMGEAPLTAADLPGTLAASDRSRLDTYLERRQALAGTNNSEAGPGSAERQRVALEIAATVQAEGIETTAQAIAASLGPAADTATSNGNPAAGVAWAESLVRDADRAPALPWLYAFLASRYRLQFEGAAEDRPLLERLAKKYKTMLDRVRNAGDPLFVLLADDLDARAGLSPGATRHPRQYLPET